MTLFTMLRRRYAVRPKARSHSARLLGLALTMVAGGALAADCDMHLSNAEVDYGSLNRGEMEIRGNAPIDLGKRQLTLTAVCRQATTMGLRFAGEAADSNSYRFAGKGRFTVKLSNAILDGTTVQLAPTTGSDGASSAQSAALVLRPNERISATAMGMPAVGKVLSVQVEIQAYVDETTTRARDVTSLEGRGALTLQTQ